MGEVNWFAVILAGAAAAAVLWLFWRGRILGASGWLYLLQLIPAAMLGHALARIGTEKLAVKPWLYFMQAGGLAVAFVIPALWMVGARHGTAKSEAARDSAAFLFAYLAMGAVFYFFG